MKIMDKPQPSPTAFKENDLFFASCRIQVAPTTGARHAVVQQREDRAYFSGHTVHILVLHSREEPQRHNALEHPLGNGEMHTRAAVAAFVPFDHVVSARAR
jgi:hypothetical protein